MTNLEIQACYAIKALAQHAERIATALEAIAKKLDKIEKPSTYFTPKGALDVVANDMAGRLPDAVIANPPFGEAASVDEAVAILRSITFATKVHDAMSLPEVYDLLCEQASHIEMALGGKEEGQK